MATSQSDFNPDDYSNVPLYNIQAVATATGVPAITLRSWERRYGIPRPQRDAKGYRLYSRRDVAVAKWLRDQVEAGVGISRAVRVLESRAVQQFPIQDSVPLSYQVLRERLLAAAKRLDETSVNAVIAEALMVGSVEDVTLLLLEPVLHEIGELWASGALSVTMEHFASNLIRGQVAQLVHISPAPIRNATLLVGCAPGELHDIGALMLSLFFRRRGFDVIYAGASVEESALVNDVSRIQPDGVCLSATGKDTAHSLTAVFQRLLPTYTGILAYGGRIYSQEPDLLRTTPGLFLGTDARTSTASLEEHLNQRASTRNLS